MTRLEAYAAIIEGEGLIVERFPDDEQRLRFRYEGDIYQLLTYSNDAAFCGIASHYTLPKGVTRAVALREANDLTMRTKVVKAYLTPGRGIRFAAELYLDDPERLRPLFVRLIRSLQSSGSGVFDRMKKARAAA